MKFKSVAIGCVLACVVLSVHSLTLGRSRGAAWIGQPLELVVQVQLDPGQTDGAVCAEADVFHADSRQDPARIRVSTEPTAQPDTFNVRITSAALVDEPVVTVYLRAGCTQKSSRKYVLLADFPSEGNAPLSRAPEPVAPVVPTVVPASSAGTSGTATSSSTASGESPTALSQNAPVAKPEPQRPPKPVVPRKEVVKEPAAKPVTPAASKPSPPKPAAPPPVKESKPRLKLDPLENLTERIKTLESTTVALPPENAASDAGRMEQLQNDVRALLEQAAKNEASLTAMRVRMEKAEAERVPMAVVYGLVALIVASLGGLAYLWTRRQRNLVWEQASPVAPLQPSRPARDDLPETAPQGETRPQASTPGKPLAPEPDSGVDVNLMDMDEESFSELMEVKPPPTKAAK